MAHSPDSAESHFSHPRITAAFTPSGIESLKTIILNPLIQNFKNPPKATAGEDSVSKTAAPKTTELSTPEDKLKRLASLCEAYLKHLGNPSDAKGKAKHALVTQMLMNLSNPTEDTSTRIDKMSKLLTEEKKDLLKEHRSGIKFLENVLNALSFGFYSKATKGTFSFWKSHGEVLTDNIEKETKPTQSQGMTG